MRYVKKAFSYSHPLFCTLLVGKMVSFWREREGFFRRIFIFFVFFLEKFLKIGVLLIFFPSIVGVVVT